MSIDGSEPMTKERVWVQGLWVNGSGCQLSSFSLEWLGEMMMMMMMIGEGRQVRRSAHKVHLFFSINVFKKKKGKGKRAPSLPTPSVHWAQAAGARGSPPGEGVGAEGSDIDAAGHWRRCPTRLAPRRAEECHGCIGVKPQGCRAWISPAQVRVNRKPSFRGSRVFPHTAYA